MLVVIAKFSNEEPQEPETLKKNSEKTETKKAIKDLMPVDIYLNMENRGFNTKKFLNGGDECCLWSNEKEINGIEYRITTYSHNATSVQSIRVYAIINDLINRKISSALKIFEFVISIPFEESKKAEVQKWIKENFNKDRGKATIVIDNTRLTLTAPTKFVRILDIEPNF